MDTPELGHWSIGRAEESLQGTREADCSMHSTNRRGSFTGFQLRGHACPRRDTEAAVISLDKPL